MFVGLATLDLVQRVERIPGPDAKATADWQELSAGGPALNAAVTFAALGGRAVLVSRVGDGPMGRLIADDLRRHGVLLVDLAAPGFAPPVSAVAVEAATGYRQVVSTDARGPVAAEPIDARRVAGGLRDALIDLGGAGADASPAVAVLELDGHHADLAHAVLDVLRPGGAGAVVLDAGRPKPQFADLLPRCTDVVCSADFRLGEPEAADEPRAALLAGLLARGVRVAASTDGPRPVLLRVAGPDPAVIRLPVPAVAVVDTLGAGDALHGAYAWARAHGAGPAHALRVAATVASRSCEQRGTRAWLSDLADLDLPSLDVPGLDLPSPDDADAPEG